MTPKKHAPAIVRCAVYTRKSTEEGLEQNFNSLEVTAIVAKRFLGVRYTVVTAHSRHLQRSCYLDDTAVRRASQHG